MGLPKYKDLTPRGMDALDRALRYYGYAPGKETRAEAKKELYKFLLERAESLPETPEEVERFLEGLAPGTRMQQKKIGALRIAARVAASR